MSSKVRSSSPPRTRHAQRRGRDVVAAWRDVTGVFSVSLLCLNTLIHKASWRGGGAGVAAGVALKLQGLCPSLGATLIVIGVAFLAARLLQPLDALYRKRLRL